MKLGFLIGEENSPEPNVSRVSLGMSEASPPRGFHAVNQDLRRVGGYWVAGKDREGHSILLYSCIAELTLGLPDLARIYRILA